MPIEYAPQSWNALTGCQHSLAQCPVADQCWARSMAKRFHGGGFEPRFHPERLEEPLHWRKPRRVAVCFMGDLFGEWVPSDVIWRVIAASLVRPHTFLFLTKKPGRLAEFSPWPDNAWVGASATDAGTLNSACLHLYEVQVKVRWISLEPLMDWKPLFPVSFPPHISWLVIGSYSGRSRVQPQREWIAEIEAAADRAGIAVWEKNNLQRILGRKLRQNLPHVEGQ